MQVDPRGRDTFSAVQGLRGEYRAALPAFLDSINNLADENARIAGIAARDNALILNDRFVRPICSSVDQAGLDQLV